MEPAALARFLPAWQGVAPAPVRGTLGADVAAAASRPGRPRAAGRGRRPAGRRADPGLGAGARRAAGPGARLPAAASRRARRPRRGGLDRVRAARPRRRADRALPAGTGRRPAGGARGVPARRLRTGRTGRGTTAIREWLARRGASFYRELFAAAGGGSDREVLDALWDLAWAGEVTNDTFAPLRALRWKRPGGDRRPRPGRLATLGPPEAAGRWSLVEGGRAQAATRRPASVPAPPGATERLHALALALLDRHGVLTREAVMGEGVEGGFAGVYPVLRALEEAGRIRRGYFVDGLGAAQFALAGAIDRLRAVAGAGRRAAAGRPPRRGRPGPAVRRRAAVAAPRRRRPAPVPAGRRGVRRAGRRGGRPLRGARRQGARDLPGRRRPGARRAGARARSAACSATAACASSSSPASTARPSRAEHPWRARLVEAGFVPGYRGLALRPRR